MVTWRDDEEEGKRNRDEAVDESQGWTMEMNSTTTTIVPDYYNASKSVVDDGPYECDQEVNTYGLSDFIIYGVLINLIGLFGIFGNTISMIILSRPQMKSSINYLLIGLARCDTVLIIVAVSPLYISVPSSYIFLRTIFLLFRETSLKWIFAVLAASFSIDWISHEPCKKNNILSVSSFLHSVSYTLFSCFSSKKREAHSSTEKKRAIKKFTPRANVTFI